MLFSVCGGCLGSIVFGTECVCGPAPADLGTFSDPEFEARECARADAQREEFLVSYLPLELWAKPKGDR